MSIDPRWPLLISLAISLSAPYSVYATIPDSRTDSAQLQANWRQFLERDAGRAPGMAFPFSHCFRRAALAHDLPASLLLAVARGESDFDPNARSNANAHGLMQIQWPVTANHLGIKRLSDLYRPCANVDAGARYLKELLTRYRGDLHRALAAYNYGPGRIPVGDATIPRGADWYSGYIYRHLTYVLGRVTPVTPARPARKYERQGKLQLARFSRAYRARAFIAALEQSAPELKLDWFRTGVGGFRVVLRYDGIKDLSRGKRLLARVGFPIR